MKALFAAILIVALSSCEFDQTLQYRIDSQVSAHVESFLFEASLRGRTIPRENLMVLIADHADEGGPSVFRSGAGFSTSNGSQRIVFIWRSSIEHYGADSEAIEHLVFHELGHAVLRRPHCDHYSIMQESISLREYAGKPELRAELLDELFSTH